MFENGTSATVFTCYDLRTGQVFWDRAMLGYPNPQYIEYYFPTATIGGAGGSPGHEADVGWQINFISISGGRLYKYNPTTGAPSSNISLSPITSATYYGPALALSVQDLGAAAANATGGRYRLINWTTAGTSSNFTSRILSNISWPMSGLGSGFANVIDYEAALLASCAWANPPGPQWCIGVELKVTDLRTGQDLWSYETNDTISENAQSPSSFVFDRGRLAFGAHGRHWSCFDGRTGRKLWTSEQSAYPWGAWWPYNTASMDITQDIGAIITHTYEGVYAINWADGKILWHFTDPNPVPFEGPYDATPFFTSVQLADGKVYAYNGEHTASFPRDRGWSIYCINATNGELLWKMKNPMTPSAIADGYLCASNPYDGNMYVFGRGKSATTVTAPDVFVPLGTGFTIKGTVLDQSPAQPGTPCVSKDSMTTQMENIHMQMPITGLWGNESLTGVPVTLTAIGSRAQPQSQHQMLLYRSELHSP
jgi:outer membrane protein assembly factor BamB